MGRSRSAVFADFHGVNSLFVVKGGQGCDVPSMEGERGGEHSQLSGAQEPPGTPRGLWASWEKIKELQDLHPCCPAGSLRCTRPVSHSSQH